MLSGAEPFDEATMLDDDHVHGIERAAAVDPAAGAAPQLQPAAGAGAKAASS